MELEIDPLNSPWVLLALSILPGLVYVTLYYNRDKHRKEPFGVVLRAFFWGAAIVFPIGLLQLVLPSEPFLENPITTALYMVLVVGFSEELGKWIVTRFYSYRNEAFDEITDGLVYGACAGAGFAIFENLFYVFEHGFETGIIRSILSVPGHLFWGAISGYWFAMYKFGGASRSDMLVKGLGVAIVSHGLFNTCVSFPALMLGAPAIIIWNFRLVRNYFRQALDHDALHMHTYSKTPNPVLSPTSSYTPSQPSNQLPGFYPVPASSEPVRVTSDGIEFSSNPSFETQGGQFSGFEPQPNRESQKSAGSVRTHWVVVLGLRFLAVVLWIFSGLGLIGLELSVTEGTETIEGISGALVVFFFLTGLGVYFFILAARMRKADSETRAANL